jgi:hypothetical protein
MTKKWWNETALASLLSLGVLWQPLARAQIERVNLARLQYASSDSAAAGKAALMATDGVVGNTNSWTSTGPGPHWLKIALPVPMLLGSAQLYLGSDDTAPVMNFSLQYFSSNSWVNIPSASFSGNTATVFNVVFSSPITASLVRWYSTDARVTVREIALFAPNGPAGYPLGTDVSLNLGKKCAVLASSVFGNNFAGCAVDGYAGTNGGWQTANINGPHTLEIDFPAPAHIGSAQVYSGSALYPALSGFTLNYWNGSGWSAIPGAAVTGNSQKELNVLFSAPVSTTKVQLSIPGIGTQFVRELAIFPAGAGAAGYPLWTDVVSNDPPTTKWETYGDGFWSIVNGANGNALTVSPSGASQSPASGTDAAQQFQILYNLDSDTFRLRHRSTWRCLAAQNAGNTPGTGVIEEPAYSAMPHELWRLQSIGGGTVRVLNVWSGLALQTDGQNPATATLATPSADPRQQWLINFQTNYPRKGVAGNEASWFRLGASWDYNWSRNPGFASPAEVAYSPQQWNGAAVNTLPLWYPGWHTSPKPTALLGFNEPDLSNQANMTVSNAISLWPQLQATDLPLVSPATSWAFGGWLSNFYFQAASAGLRNDYTAVHWYSYPSTDSFIGHLQSVYNTWGKPVWITEFSSGYTGTWSEEGNYTFLAEFLWRAEDLPWLRRYGIFCYSQDPPANPWDETSPASAVFKSDGVTFTTLGELYAAWDADRTIRADTNYILHNKGACFRVSNAGAAALGISTIYVTGPTVQWQLTAAPGANRYYVTSTVDGTRLSWNGSQLSLADAGVTGGTVEWTYTADAKGYFFIDHPASGERLSLTRLSNASGTPTSTNLTMAATGTVNDYTRWRFIKPYQPVPLGLTALAGNGQVALSWNAVPGAGSYNVKRATSSGGPYVPVAAGVATANFTDPGLLNNAIYYYVVSAVNAAGESDNSVEVAALPGGQAVNCGGGIAGWFGADFGFSGGNTSSTTSTIDLSGLTNPAPQAVYQANRYGNSTCTISGLTPNVTYWVRLHFAESYWSTAGKRVFNVSINGATRLSNFDIFSAAGAQNKAAIKEFYATANSSGQMVIQFATVTDNAQVNGIEVLAPKPLVPVGLWAAAGNGQVTLMWPACAGGVSYNVYRAAASGGPYALISTAGTVTETAYIDSTVANGTTYYYVLSATNPYGESGKSSEACVTTAVAVSPPVSVSIGTSGSNIVLSWPTGALQSATNLAGPWGDVGGAGSPFVVTPSEPQRFYRVRLN